MKTVMTNIKIKVGIVGASGYTGIELVRLLSQHPHAQIVAITSREHDKKMMGDVFSHLKNIKLKFTAPDYKKLAKMCQVVFLCLPHHESMNTAKVFRDAGVKVIDLSSDFRFESIKTYENTYGAHSQKALAKNAVYGFCESNRDLIKEAPLVAVPGCYVTSILIALQPLIKNHLIDLSEIVCDSKSGTSGAGRSAKTEQLFAEIHGDFKAYSVANHRHRPEIEEKLSLWAASPVKISFTPHLLPIDRGILSTIYVKPLRELKAEQWRLVFKKFYKNHPFVTVLNKNELPRVSSVVGSNFCHLGVVKDDHTSRLILVSALDNLLKGASGQAVQCFNLMSDLKEDTGLNFLSHYP